MKRQLVIRTASNNQLRPTVQKSHDTCSEEHHYDTVCKLAGGHLHHFSVEQDFMRQELKINQSPEKRRSTTAVTTNLHQTGVTLFQPQESNYPWCHPSAFGSQ
jgi:hypothetical protein